MEKRRRKKKFEWMMRRWILHKYDTSIHSIYRNKYLVLYLKKRSIITIRGTEPGINTGTWYLYYINT